MFLNGFVGPMVALAAILGPFLNLAIAGERKLLDRLPFVKKSPPENLQSDQASSIQIRLDPNWEVNKKAPSWMAFFVKAPNGQYQILQEYTRAELSQLQVQLPKIKNKMEYRLQGTLYFCKEGAGAACSVESRDIQIRGSDQAGAKKQIVIELPMPARR